jgi:hypothetical protein
MIIFVKSGSFDIVYKKTLIQALVWILI